MPESKIIADFPRCYNCNSEEKVSERGVADLIRSGKVSSNVFTCLRKDVVPLEQPMLAGVLAQCIITSFDICAGCGTERCTRAELQSLPVKMPDIPHPGPGAGPGPFSRQ